MKRTGLGPARDLPPLPERVSHRKLEPLRIGETGGVRDGEDLETGIEAPHLSEEAGALGAVFEVPRRGTVLGLPELAGREAQQGEVVECGLKSDMRGASAGNG